MVVTNFFTVHGAPFEVLWLGLAQLHQLGQRLHLNSFFLPLWRRVLTWRRDLRGFVQQVGAVRLVVLHL